MQERICDGGTSSVSTIQSYEQAEHDCNGGRFSHLQKLLKVSRLNCCSLAEDDVPSRSRRPQMPDRREHKPFNGVCVLPNMPDVDALIQEFEASYMNKSPTSKKKNVTDVAKGESVFVKKIIEIYETKKEGADPWPLDGRQAIETTIEEKRSRGETKPKENKSLFGIAHATKKAEKTRDNVEKYEFTDATDTTVNADSREINAEVEKKDDNVDEVEENNDPDDDVVETSKLTADVSKFHVNSSSLRMKKGSTNEKDKGKSSRKLRGLLCKFNRSDSKRMTQKCRLAFLRRNKLWHTKRKGRIFSESLVRQDLTPQFDEAVPASSSCTINDNLPNVNDHNVLTVVESQDDSDNSYKNLQIEMFDFEDEGRWSEAQDFEHIDDSLSISSVDHFLPSLDHRSSFYETADMTLASSSFENENNASDRVSGYDENTLLDLTAITNESAKEACLEQSTEIENVYPCRDLKLQRKLSGKKSLKKILSLFSTKRYFEKRTKNAISKAKSSGWRSQWKSQRTSMLSPDSGFDEHSVPVISPRDLPTSCFPSEKFASSGYHGSPLTFRTFRPRDSFPHDGVGKCKRRLELDKLSHEKLVNAQDETSCALLDAQTDIVCYDLSPASSSPSLKDSTSVTNSPRFSPPQLLKHLYLPQKISKSTCFSLTRVDEISEEPDKQLDMSDLRLEYNVSLSHSSGWTSSSPYLVCKELRWRSIPTLSSFPKESSCYDHESSAGKMPRVSNIYRDSKRNVPIFGTGSLTNITGSSCYATVKPRNWKPYMRPERPQSFEEKDGIKRRGSV